MGSEWTVQMHVKGVGEVFRQAAVVERLESMGRRIATEANDAIQTLYPDNGYNALDHFGVWKYTTTHGTTGVAVGTQTELAKYAQAHHSTLTKAMNAARG